MALPTIILVNTTGSAIELKQLAITVPGSGSLTVSDFDRPDEVLNDDQLQVHLDSGSITVTFNGDVLTSEQTKSKIQPITALDIRHNLGSAVDPTVDDDDNAGYSVGSVWLNTTANRAYRCMDDATGAAVWIFDGPSPSGGSTLAWGNQSVGGTTSLRYLDPWGAQNQIAGTDGTTNARHVAPRGGTLRNMYVRSGNPDGNGNSISYTVRVNGAITALVVTMASTDPQASDLVDTVAVTAGQNIDVEVSKSGNIGNSPDGITVTLEFA